MKPNARARRGLQAWMLLPLGILLLLGWSILARARHDNLNTRIGTGQRPPRPAFNLPVLWPRTAPWPDGLARAVADQRLSANELRGKPVVLNFWASWCIPCQVETPLLGATARRHPEVRFVGVDVQDLIGDAIAFSRHYRTPYVSVHDAGRGIYRDYGLTGVPETFYLDAEGRIVAHDPGAVDQASLTRGILRATAKSSP